MQRRVFLLGLLLSFFLLVQAGSAASAAPVQITDLPVNQGRPDVRNSIIVWKDNRSGNWDIYFHNLLTGIEEPVFIGFAYQNVPVTNGSIVAWQDNRDGANDIYFKDLASGGPELLVTGDGNQGLPAIDGDTIAYVDDALGNNNIYAIDLNTRTITTVTTNTANQWQPRISGNRIIWEDERNGNWDIYMRELPDGDELPVAAGPGDQRVADIDGDLIVWQDENGGIYNILMKDLGTGLTENVTDDSDYQASPRVSNDLVVWENYSYLEENFDIYAKDLTSGQTLVIAGGPQTQARPAVDGEVIAWEEDSSGVFDVWMERIDDVTPPQLSNISPAEGEDTGCQAPLIEAELSDNRTGIDIYSIQLLLDGEDVTADAATTDASLSYQAPRLEDGSHTATLTVSDIAGNTASTTWQFITASPLIELNFLGSFWVSYIDYLNRELSVDYEVANTSTSAASVETDILAAPSTSGVMLASPTPVQLGSIDPLASGNTTVKYLVPMSVSSFRSDVFMRSASTCGIETFLPGPLPGS